MIDKVTVYSATWCGFCHAAKQYLDKLGIKYTDKDVDNVEGAAQEAFDKSGQRAIPVIDIDGDIIIGFNQPRVSESLRAHHLIS